MQKDSWTRARYTLRYRWKALVLWVLPLFCLCAAPLVAWAAATLENPVPEAIKSGVGIVSGWVCDAEDLMVSFDGGPQTFVPYGSERLDTAGVGGDSDNGFGLLINYNELGDGPHTITLYADGMVVTQVSFSVQTLGTNFLRGVTGNGTVELSNGIQARVQWEETTQGFTIIGYDDGQPTSGSGEDDDTIEGGPDDDIISGGPGNDVLEGGEGNDRLEGGPDDDIISGGPGNDVLIVGAYDDDPDEVYGGPGNDILGSSGGDDKLYGGPGNDLFIPWIRARGKAGGATIKDFTPGEDTIDICASGCRLPPLSFEDLHITADGTDTVISFTPPRETLISFRLENVAVEALSARDFRFEYKPPLIFQSHGLRGNGS